MNKTLKISLIGIAVLIVGAGIWYVVHKKEKTTKISVQTQPVQLGDILTTITATGTVEPLVTVEIGTQVSGEISKVYVDYSSVVKKGQKLAELDKSTLQASLNSSKASYESAKNELTYQESNYNRIKQLYESQSVSKTDYETALYQYNTAKFAFTRAEQDLDKAKTNLGYADIYSPIDGVVLSRTIEEGQTVAASYSTPTMFTIAQDLTKMRVIADVDEADIGSVKVGQNVLFTVDAFPNDEFTGKVTMIRLEAQISSNVVTYEVVINAPNPDLKLLPGLTANISIFTNEERGVLVIPTKAQRVHPTADILAQYAEQEKIVMTDSAGASGVTSAENPTRTVTVWIKNANGSLTEREITTGKTDGSNIEVTAGLSEGENVVTEISASADLASTADKEQTRSPFMPQRPNQSNSTTKK
jgi:HlyD family secretion protein